MWDTFYWHTAYIQIAWLAFIYLASQPNESYFTACQNLLIKRQGQERFQKSP